MSVHEMHEAMKAHDREHGKLPQKLDASVPVNYPLPPEGQRSSSNDEPTSMSLADAEKHASTGFLSSSSRDDDQVRMWEPGYYLWSTKSRWGAQEHMELMMRDLNRQTQWMKKKADTNAKAKRMEEGLEQADDDQPVASKRSFHFPDLADSSFLVPIPPPHVVIGTAIHKYLEPTNKLLGIVRESIQAGHQQELVKRMWEKALTPEPWILVRNVCTKMWKVLNGGPPDDDGEERNKGGKV